MPSFQYIQLLFLLLFVPVLTGLYFFALSRKKKAAKKIGDATLVKKLTAGYSSSSYFKKFVLVTLAFAALVLALANLRGVVSEQKVNREGIDVMIALDVSKSMLAQDIKPSRLDRAKQVLSRLIDKLGNDRVGIVIFAGKAYLQMPLTGDNTAAKMYLSSAGTESVPTQGTVIGDALRACNASFNAKEKKYKAVVLISDGEDHDETAVKTATEMAANGVEIYTIGIGSPQGTTLMEEGTNEIKKDNEGNPVVSKLNETTLKTIAEKGNGEYLLYNNTEAVVSTLFAQLSSMDQRMVTDASLVNYKSYFQYFLLFAFLLLLIEMFISENKKIKKGLATKMAVCLLFIIISGSGFAQSNKILQHANKAYQKKDYVKAADLYNKVLEKESSNGTAQFNMGNAMYKSDKKEDAVKLYDNAAANLNEPEKKSNAYYNKGVVLQNDNKLNECIAAYKKALIEDPANEDARQNLQKALQQQKQEQQKQQKKKEEEKKQQQQQKQEPKPQPSKLTKQDAEDKLKALMQQEKNLQDKLHKVSEVSVNKPEKDW